MGRDRAGWVHLPVVVVLRVHSCRVSVPLGKPVPASVQDFGIRLLPISIVVRQELGTDLTGGLWGTVSFLFLSLGLEAQVAVV